MRNFYGTILVFVFTSLLLLSGCSRAIPVHIEVTGTGVATMPVASPFAITPPSQITTEATVQEEAPQVFLPPEEISATGFGAPPADAASKSQARLMAKQAAKADALRNLAQALNGIKVDSKTTVKDFITQNDEIRTQVDGFIRGAEVLSEEEKEDGTFEVKMRINPRPIFDLFTTASQPPPPEPPVDAGAISTAPAQARAMAERAAMLDAQRQILEHLKGVHITSSSTVEDFMTQNDSIKSRVQGTVRKAKVVDKRYNRDGSVEVDMVLDHPDIRQVVE